MSNVTIKQALAESSLKIERVDAQLLLQHVLQVSHTFLLTHTDSKLTQDQSNQYEDLVIQRVKGFPVAYLVGQREFYDLTFYVNTSVLIPRPETELLIELVLERISGNSRYEILELGTGSGAIAITLAKHCPNAYVTAVDLSVDALAVAKANAQNFGIKNITFALSNWFEKLAEKKFDFIVSNPPYIAKNDPHLVRGDVCFEPSMALIAGGDGLACLRMIISGASVYLKTGGWLLFEHGYDQANDCRKLLEQYDFSNILVCKDLAGIHRVSGGQLP